MLTHGVIRGGELIGDGNNSSDMKGDDIYKRRVELVLVLSSDSYSDEEISISASGPSSCPILHCLLTTFFNY